MKNEPMTTDALKATQAAKNGLSLTEVEAQTAPNGGTVIWHHLEEGDGEDYFCLCWQRADGTVIENEYAYDLTPVGQEPLEWQAGF